MRRMVAPTTAALVVLVLLSGCSESDDSARAESGALAAARVYVDAIAALDVATADAMTDPAAFDTAAGPDRDVDIRAALPDVADPITDPWVTLVSPTYEARYGVVAYVVDVSYDVGDLTGGGTFVVTLDGGYDSELDLSEVDNWTVTRPMIARGNASVDGETVSSARIGAVDVTSGDGFTGVWGYPGGYLLESTEPVTGVEPVQIVVGADDAPQWDERRPELGAADDG